jgi:hypothetical protein
MHGCAREVVRIALSENEFALRLRTAWAVSVPAAG